MTYFHMIILAEERHDLTGLFLSFFFFFFVVIGIEPRASSLRPLNLRSGIQGPVWAGDSSLESFLSWPRSSTPKFHLPPLVTWDANSSADSCPFSPLEVLIQSAVGDSNYPK
jgi:hypothetical protein